MSQDKLRKLIKEELARNSFAKIHDAELGGHEKNLINKLYDIIDNVHNNSTIALYKIKKLIKKGKFLSNKSTEEKKRVIGLLDTFFNKAEDAKNNLQKILDDELLPSLTSSAISEDNYPAGAENDSMAPWNKKEYKGEKVVKYEPNYEFGTFYITLDDKTTTEIDFEYVIEEYFKKHKGSFEAFNKMFPESEEAYNDIVKYLIGQGYDFTDVLQEKISDLIASGDMENGHQKSISSKDEHWEELQDLDENQIMEIVNKAIVDSDAYLIYHTYIEKGYPKHNVVDTANVEDEAIKKVSTLEHDYPEEVFYYDKKAPIQQKYKLN